MSADTDDRQSLLGTPKPQHLLLPYAIREPASGPATTPGPWGLWWPGGGLALASLPAYLALKFKLPADAPNWWNLNLLPEPPSHKAFWEV